MCTSPPEHTPNCKKLVQVYMRAFVIKIKQKFFMQLNQSLIADHSASFVVALSNPLTRWPRWVSHRAWSNPLLYSVPVSLLSVQSPFVTMGERESERSSERALPTGMKVLSPDARPPRFFSPLPRHCLIKAQGRLDTVTQQSVVYTSIFLHNSKLEGNGYDKGWGSNLFFNIVTY